MAKTSKNLSGTTAVKDTAGDTVVVERESAQMHQTAMGIHYDGKTNEWMLTFIKYNPDTLESGEMSKVPCGKTKDLAIERFKIAAIDLNIVG